jgi:molecular chaperone GrpE (heat shock protein)
MTNTGDRGPSDVENGSVPVQGIETAPFPLEASAAADSSHPPVSESVAESPQSAGNGPLVLLAQALERLEDAVRTRLAEADRSGSVIDRLEAEVRRLRQRDDERRLEPVIKGIISLFDQVAQIASSVRSRRDELRDAERGLAGTILALEQQVLELLQGLGATAYAPEPASPFDGKRQEVLSTVATEDPEQHLRIESVLRRGFEFAGRVCRPAAVQVFTLGVPTQPRTEEI